MRRANEHRAGGGPGLNRRSLLIGGGAAAGLLLAWELWPRHYVPNLATSGTETPINATYTGDPLSFELLEPTHALHITADKEPVAFVGELTLPDGRVFGPVANPDATTAVSSRAARRAV